MENSTMGRVIVPVKIENLNDLYNAQLQLVPPEKIRRIEIADALVDTGATLLSLPKRFIAQLGLLLIRQRKAMTSAGLIEVGVYGTVRLTVQGRDCTIDVTEVPD